METCRVTKNVHAGRKIMTLLYIGNDLGDKGTSIGEDVTYTPGEAF